MAGEPADAFPAPLYALATDGTPGTAGTEPLAADVRPASGEGRHRRRRLALLRIAARLLSCGFDDLMRRDAERRRRRLVQLGLMAVSVAVAILGATVFALYERDRADEMTGLRDRADEMTGLRDRADEMTGLRDRADEARGKAELAKAEEEKARGVAEDERGKARAAEAGEKKAKEVIAFLNYAHAVDLAFREYGVNNFTRARELLDGCPAELRGWEWHYVHRLCHADLATLNHAGPVVSAVYSADGRRVVTASEDMTVRVWDADIGKLLLTLIGHTGLILAGRFSDDTRVLTAGHADTDPEGQRTVRVIVYDARPVNRAFIRPTPLDIPPREIRP